jgi:hypothetical protein
MRTQFAATVRCRLCVGWALVPTMPAASVGTSARPAVQPVRGMELA